MNYWITTHWPRREDQTTESLPDIWLPDGREAPGTDIACGDLVVIYESLTGRALLRRKPDGSLLRVNCMRGKGGVICIARVRTSLAAEQDSTPENYADGTTIWWRWRAAADVVTRSGFIPRSELAPMLGYAPSYAFRGFGEQHSGLRRLSEREFDEIIKRFHESRPIKLKAYPIPRTARGGRAEGGESERHLELKNYIAANPSRALKEDGLSTLEVEYSFATGDRADIVLADQYKRVVAVEVELEVAATEEAGPLQAIKYRHMLEWSADRALGDSRAFLVAYKIHESMKERCKRFGIECHEIHRSAVEKHGRNI